MDSIVIQYKNGQTNVFDILPDEYSEDYLTIARKIFKQQNYWPEKYVVKEAILIKEE